MKKCLLALDCSVHSDKAAAYLSDVAPHVPDAEVILFTSLSGIPRNAEKVAAEEPELHGDEDHLREVSEVKAMHGRAADLLVQGGLPEARLKSLVQPERRGIAQDIVDTALQYQCDTIVVGRRGLSKIGEILGGSVSRGLLQKATSMAIWIIE